MQSKSGVLFRGASFLQDTRSYRATNRCVAVFSDHAIGCLNGFRVNGQCLLAAPWKNRLKSTQEICTESGVLRDFAFSLWSPTKILFLQLALMIAIVTTGRVA